MKQYHIITKADLRDRNSMHGYCTRRSCVSHSLNRVLIVHKCRTISLSQYTFNQFWKPFFLFVSPPYSIWVSERVFVFLPSRPIDIGCKRLFFTLVDLFSFTSFTAVVFIPFHFMFICFAFCFCLSSVWHDVLCWVHARNQYSILIVLYGAHIHRIHHITAQHNANISSVLCYRGFIFIFLTALFFVRFSAVFSGIEMCVFLMEILAYLFLRFANHPIICSGKQIACVLCAIFFFAGEICSQINTYRIGSTFSVGKQMKPSHQRCLVLQLLLRCFNIILLWMSQTGEFPVQKIYYSSSWSSEFYIKRERERLDIAFQMTQTMLSIPIQGRTWNSKRKLHIFLYKFNKFLPKSM